MFAPPANTVNRQIVEYRISGAFTIEDENIRKQFETEYSKTAPLYYRGQIPFDTILARIQRDLVRL
jgi:hypothetical protein